MTETLRKCFDCDHVSLLGRCQSISSERYSRLVFGDVACEKFEGQTDDEMRDVPEAILRGMDVLQSRQE
jgi:hypothetical protein